MTTTSSTYVFSNDDAVAPAHHEYLSAILNQHTVSRLVGLRLSGANCLEVGAGAGSIAVWLADQVGPDGRVLATDLHPMPIVDHPRLEVRRHDIVAEPVPDGAWDLIHARLLLQHLPERHEVLDKLASALAPGGALLIEDWDHTWRSGRVLNAPTLADAILFERFHDTLAKVFSSAGVDGGWASRVPAAMLAAGLVDVQAQIHARSWPGGSAFARLIAGDITQLDGELRAHGMTQEELERVRQLMDDPTMVIRTPPAVSTLGYRPGGAVGSDNRDA